MVNPTDLPLLSISSGREANRTYGRAVSLYKGDLHGAKENSGNYVNVQLRSAFERDTTRRSVVN